MEKRVEYDAASKLLALKIIGNGMKRLQEDQIASLKSEAVQAGKMDIYVALDTKIGANLSSFNQAMDKALVIYGLVEPEDVWDIPAKTRCIACAILDAKAEIEAKLAAPIIPVPAPATLEPTKGTQKPKA